MNYQRVVILKEKAAERYLPIWIGPAEADAIAVKLQGATVPRPLSHDLLHSVIGALGLNVDGGQMEIDSRPSDALALAVRTDSPIYVEESVLDRAGILLDKETGKPISEEERKGADSKKVSEEEMRRMSAFTDFIKTLDLDDFDKHKS